jgi:alkanesulfonate monooxygenase SsuD/methylene tetrahydromethanopterin reductase-like flavin-dependent oxidoreductase (luciferase family)
MVVRQPREGVDGGRTRRVVTGGSGAVRAGLHSGQQYSDFSALRELWRTAESLGYDWVSVFEHLRPPVFGPAGPCLDGIAALAALAESTERVRCAMLVSTVAWRHPALLAMAAATVDQISGGRLEFGLGTGGADLAYEQYGMTRPPPDVRAERLGEACVILRALWGGGPVNHTGKHFVLRDAYLNPRPVQDHMPLVIGGSGPRTLRIAAEHADVWNCVALPLGHYAEAAAAIGAHCARAGRAPAGIRRSITFRAVIRADATEARRARDALSADPHGRAADLPEYLSFGTARDCLDALAPYAALGVRDFLLGVRPPVDWVSVEHFAADVVPALRELAGS